MSADESVTAVPGEELDADAVRLRELGYRQELRRKLSGFSNFAVSFSIISVLAGCLTSYGPVTASSFNYAPAAVLVVLALAGIWWLVSARRWFTGPPAIRAAERP